MREFKAVAFDNQTGMRMVLSETSYNKACDWLVSKGYTHYSNFEFDNNYITLTFTKPDNKVFIYDEDRGYLLMEDE